MSYFMIILNLIPVVFMVFFLAQEGFPNYFGKQLVILSVFAVSGINLLYIVTKISDESLIGLWIQVKRKKLEKDLQEKD